MGTSLVIVEKELRVRLPTFREVLPKTLPAERLMQTVLMACEKTPRLLDTSPQSIMSSAITAAVLGLEVDGVTGQGFILPFKGQAQFLVGYKGYPTIGARSGMALNWGVVREGDDFDYAEGDGGFIKHRRALSSRVGRKIICAWATGEAIGRPPVRIIVAYDDILETMKRSPGYNTSFTPWKDYDGPGHEGMVAKTAVRRLGARVPVVAFQQATYIEDAHDRGHVAHLRPDGAVVLDGDIVDPSKPPASPYPERSGPITDLQIEQREQPGVQTEMTVNQTLALLRTMNKAEADQWAKDNAAKLARLKDGDDKAYDAYEAMMHIIATRAP